jgi:hypothetical protein
MKYLACDGGGRAGCPEQLDSGGVFAHNQFLFQRGRGFMAKRIIDYSIRIALVVALAALASCGKSSDTKESTEAAKTGGQTAPAGPALDELPISPVLDKAGYKATFARKFPAQVPGKRASVVVYRSKSGRDGGVLYLQDRGNEDRVVWHWYFSDEVPDSVQPVELNDDGLWDVRMFVDGKTHDYVQDQSFTFVAPQRDDRVAMNGPSSEPVDEEGMSWHCFDSDTTTAWRSEFESGKTYIDLPTPLGIDDGILSVRLLGQDQPEKCELEVDGKPVQQFELAQTTAPQLIHLDAAAKSAKSVRLVVESTRGGADEVAISELGLQ